MLRLVLSLIIISLIAGTFGWKFYEYNSISFREFDAYEQLLSSFFTSVNGTANVNLVLGVASESCLADLQASITLHSVQRAAAGDVLIGALIPSEGFSIPMQQCAMAYFYRKGSSIYTPQSSTDTFDPQSFFPWITRAIRTSVTFFNEFDYPIVVVYHSESHSSTTVQGKLEPGESFGITSFLGHIFAAYEIIDDHPWRSRDEALALPLVDYFIVADISYTFSPHNRLETCEVDELNTESLYVPGQISCDDLHLRFVRFSLHAWYLKRQGLNFLQPKIVRPASVSALGFDLRPLPKSTYGWLRAWYDKQRLVDEIGEHTVGPCMNQQVAPSNITHLTSNLKNRLARELQPLVQQWYNGEEELELTSIYGIRKYTNGSVLRMHVDTITTHVVSAIINVDQDVVEDWQLVILDHDDEEHSVVMRPGDMLLYESAKLLHGRPDVFNGNHYDNIFVHYKPVSGWDYDWL